MDVSSMRQQLLDAWLAAGNPWLSSPEAYRRFLPGADKVTFATAISTMVLRPPHSLVRRGTRCSFEHRLRMPGDPPFEREEKVIRAKVVTRLSSAQPRLNVAQTPPEVRALEPYHLPVEHRALTPPPANTPFAKLGEVMLQSNVSPITKHKDTVSTGDVTLQPLEAAGVMESTPAPEALGPQGPKVSEQISKYTQQAILEQPLQVVLEGVKGWLQQVISDAIVDALRRTETVQVEEATIPMHVLAESIPIEPESTATVSSAQAQTVETKVDPPPIPRHNPEPRPDQNKPKLDKIVVIGLPKTNHEAELKRYFSERANMTFFGGSDNPRRIRKACRNVDRIFVMKNHLSHSITEALNADNIPYEEVIGGIVQLKEIFWKTFKRVTH